MRTRPKFMNAEFYHIYNQGVDKRNIFLEPSESKRFVDSMREFNSVSPIGSLFEHSLRSAEEKARLNLKKLVRIIAYCLNPNHFHLLLQQVSKNGVSEFMKRVGGGYTNFFNEKHSRKGALLQGRYKVKHITSNEYLLHVSGYVNLNDRVHKLKSPVIRSSWQEYISGTDGICHTKFILDQFDTNKEYSAFVEDALILMLEQKEGDNDFASLLLD